MVTSALVTHPCRQHRQAKQAPKKAGRGRFCRKTRRDRTTGTNRQAPNVRVDNLNQENRQTQRQDQSAGTNITGQHCQATNNSAAPLQSSRHDINCNKANIKNGVQTSTENRMHHISPPRIQQRQQRHHQARQTTEQDHDDET